MSIENSSSSNLEDFEVIQKLMAETDENDLLKRDPYTQRVVQTGKVDNGEPVKDFGKFFKDRLAALKEEGSGVAAFKRKDVKVEPGPNPVYEEK
jgi:hypothetical protein